MEAKVLGYRESAPEGYVIIGRSSSGSGNTQRAVAVQIGAGPEVLAKALQEGGVFGRSLLGGSERVEVVEGRVIIHTPNPGHWIGSGGNRINDLRRICPVEVKNDIRFCIEVPYGTSPKGFLTLEEAVQKAKENTFAWVHEYSFQGGRFGSQIKSWTWSKATGVLEEGKRMPN